MNNVFPTPLIFGIYYISGNEKDDCFKEMKGTVRTDKDIGMKSFPYKRVQMAYLEAVVPEKWSVRRGQYKDEPILVTDGGL